MNTNTITVNKFWNWLLPLAVTSILALQTYSVKTTHGMQTSLAVLETKVGGFTSLSARVDGNTAVLVQHGDEFKTLTSEQLRLRTIYDELSSLLNTKTADRFTGDDGKELRVWVRDQFAQAMRVSDLKHESLKREIEILKQ